MRLIHLYQKDFGYVGYQHPNGGLRIVPTAREGSVLEICHGNGSPITGPIASEQQVCLRDPAGRYFRPNGSSLSIGNASPLNCRFKIRKISGSGGSTIRHGDKVALGALQALNTRCRWLQGDSNVGIGGLSNTYGGETQQFKYLEVNDMELFTGLGQSDRVLDTPNIEAGLTVSLSHEGVPKGSHFSVKFEKVLAEKYKFNNGPSARPSAAGETFMFQIGEGTRSQRLPFVLESPMHTDPCARYALKQQTNPGSVPLMGKLTVTNLALIPWASPTRPGTQPKNHDLRYFMTRDFMNVTVGRLPLDGENELGVPRLGAVFPSGDQFAAFPVTITQGSTPLPPGDWMCVVSASAFPAGPPFQTTSSTPAPSAPGQNPVITFGSGRSFSHAVTFAAETPPNPARKDLFCIDVKLIGRGANPTIFNRRFGLNTSN